MKYISILLLVSVLLFTSCVTFAEDTTSFARSFTVHTSGDYTTAMNKQWLTASFGGRFSQSGNNAVISGSAATQIQITLPAVTTDGVNVSIDYSLDLNYDISLRTFKGGTQLLFTNVTARVNTLSGGVWKGSGYQPVPEEFRPWVKAHFNRLSESYFAYISMNV